MSPSIPATCPRCGASLPSDAPEGLCPRCLSKLPFEPDTLLPGAIASDKMPPLTPEELAPHFPNLDILECLGRGGMGIVYKARQKSLGRHVALKLLAPERANDATFAERFAREARALAALNHPNIVTIHDFGEAGGFFFLLMEYVDGVNLRSAMQSGRFTPEQALNIVAPVCEALQYAHEHGVVHRDIKPENLLLDRESRVKVADFGIAKMLHSDGADAASNDTQPAGTPQYMAPEQQVERRTDHRADIYSLGVVLYELLTGELPAADLQPPSRKVRIDVRLDEIVLRALEKSPELRFSTAAEMRTRLELLADESAPSFPPPPLPRKRRLSRILVIISVVLLLCLLLAGGLAVAWFTGRKSPPRQTSVDTPPVFNGLGWRDENLDSGHVMAWHPDGTQVTNSSECPLPSSITGDSPLRKGRVLLLLFSHPELNDGNFHRLALRDEAGQPFPREQVGWSTSVGRLMGQPMGAIFYEGGIGENDHLPRTLTVSLAYGIGPWLDGQEIAVNSPGGISLGSRVTLGGPGVRDGHATISIIHRDGDSPDNQYGVVAILRDGREIGAGVSGITYNEMSSTEEFGFMVPMDQIRYFRLRTRPIRTVEFKNVRLKNSATEAP